MREEFTDASKPEKPIGQNAEAPPVRENAETVERPDQPKIRTTEQRENAIAAIDAKRANELSQLNAARARLGLPPSDTSAAISALDRERVQLDKGTDTRAGSIREPSGQRHVRDERTTERTQLIPELQGKSRITPEIKYYFQEVLGPEETATRMEKMGPGWAPRIRAMINEGKYGELIHTFTLFDPRFTPDKIREMDEAWAERMSKLPGDQARAWGYEPGVDTAFLSGAASRRLFNDTVFNAIERTRRAGGRTQEQEN